MFPGLLYGKYLPLARLSVTSRKFTTFLLASICNLQTVFCENATQFLLNKLGLPR